MLDGEPEGPQLPPLGDSGGDAAARLPDTEAPPWSGWDVVLIVFTFVLALLAASAAGIYVAFRDHLPLDHVATDARFVVPLQILGYLAALAVMYLIARYSYGRPFWKAVQWRWPRAKLAWCMFLGGVPLALVLQMVQERLPAPPAPPIEMFFRTPGDVYWMGLLALAAAPLMEELFFRGFLYPVLRRWGVAAGVVLTSAAFSLVHGSQYAWAWSALLILFVVGLVLTGVRARLHSVAAGFLIHLGYNLTLFILLYFATDHFRHLERAI